MTLGSLVFIAGLLPFVYAPAISREQQQLGMCGACGACGACGIDIPTGGYRIDIGIGCDFEAENIVACLQFGHVI